MGADPTSLGQFDPSAGGWGGKGKDGKGKGKDGGKKGGKGKDGKPQPCFRWQNAGECPGRADGSCKYYHGMDIWEHSLTSWDTEGDTCSLSDC